MNEQIRKYINEHPTPSSNVKGNTNSNKNGVVQDYPEYKGFFSDTNHLPNGQT